MLTADCTSVMPADCFKHLTSKRNIRPKHKRSWTRIAALIASGKHEEPKLEPTRALPIHPSVLKMLETRRGPNPTQKSKSALTLLSNHETRNYATALAARDHLADYRQALLRSHIRRGANLRDTSGVYKARKNHRISGYEEYKRWCEKHSGKNTSAKAKDALQLYTLCRPKHRYHPQGGRSCDSHCPRWQGPT